MSDDFHNDDDFSWLDDEGPPDEDGDEDFDLDWLDEASGDDEEGGPTQGEDRIGVTGELPWLSDADDDEEADESVAASGRRADMGGVEERLESQLEEATPDDEDLDLPPWMQGMDTGEDEEPAEAPLPMDEADDEDEEPDWLRGVDTGGTGELDEDEPDWMQDIDTGGTGELDEEEPDWLGDAEPSGDTGELIAGKRDLFTTEAERSPDVTDEDLPDWLTGEGDEGGDADEADQDADEPAWMRGAVPDEPASTRKGTSDLPDDFLAQADHLPQTDEGDMSYDDWVAQQSASETPESDEEVPEDLFADLGDEEPGEPEDLGAEMPDWYLGMDEIEDEPDWFSEDLDDEAEAEAEPVPDDFLSELGLEGGEDAEGAAGDVDDWFADFGTGSGGEEAEEEPGWLDDLGDLEAGEEPQPEAEEEAALPAEDDFLAELEAAGEPSEEDLDSFFDSMDEFDLGEPEPEADLDFEDYFDEEDARYDAPEEEPAIDRTLHPEAPEWLSEVVVTGDESESASALIRRQTDRPLDELDDRLQSLHDAGVNLPVTDSLSEGRTETFDSVLPEMADTLVPATMEAGEEEVASDVRLSDEQQKRADLLGQLAGGSAMAARAGADTLVFEEEEAARRPRRQPRIRVDRLGISLLLAVAVLLPFVVNLDIGGLPPEQFPASSPQRAVFDTVHSVQPGQLVLVAVEYGPTAAAELDETTAALLRHVLLSGGRPVLVSGNPVGLLHGGNVLDEVLADIAADERLGDRAFTANEDYYVIRYYTGSIIGLRAFAENPAALLARDVRGATTGLDVDALGDFGLVTVIAERAEDLRAWAEQVAPLTRVPVVAATGYAAAPLAEPYVSETTGITGLLTGFRDAYTYNAMLDRFLDGEPLEEGPADEATTPTETPVPPTPTAIPPTATRIPRTPTPADLETMAIIGASTPVNMRSGPGTDFDVVGAASPGDEGVVLESNDDGSWTKLRMPDGSEGWIASALLRFEERPTTEEAPAVTATTVPASPTPEEPTPTLEQPTPTPEEATPTREQPTPTREAPTAMPATITVAVVTADGAVNVRGGPGTSYTPVDVAQPGDEFLVLGFNEDESWVQLQLPDGEEGWIAAFLLDLEERPESEAPGGEASAKRRGHYMKPLLQEEPTPTREGDAEAAPETTEAAEITPEVTATPQPTLTPTPGPESTPVAEPREGDRDSRWYGMTVGLLAAVVVIVFGNLFHIIRHILRRD